MPQSLEVGESGDKTIGFGSYKIIIISYFNNVVRNYSSFQNWTEEIISGSNILKSYKIKV